MLSFETLIEPATLAGHIQARQWRVVDCRFTLADPQAGRSAYEQLHLPGAVYAHLDDDLSGPITAQSGRHPLPEIATFAAQLGRWGIGNDTQVVAYDDAGGAIAARLWWMLRWVGHRRVAVLNGGFAKWSEDGLPLTAEQAVVEPQTYSPQQYPSGVATAQQVLESLDHGDSVLLDARGPNRYRGEAEPIDPVAGHIPGAVNAPFQDNLAEDGRFRDADALRLRFESLLAGRSGEHSVHMCGSGVTACHNLLAMEVAGLGGGQLYAGSWSEWIRNPQRPVARGD